jgi:hypothetical protein
MRKRFKMNLTTSDLLPVGGTDSLPHPGNFPVGSPESRAAARAMIRPDQLRAGDEGTLKCGCCFCVFNDVDSHGDPTGKVLKMIIPTRFSDGMTHVHDHEIVSNKMLWDRA